MQIVVIILGVVIIALGAILIFVPSEENRQTETVIVDEVTRPETEAEPVVEAVENEPTPPGDGSATPPTPEVGNLPATVEPTPSPRAGVAASTATFSADVSYLTPARTAHDMRVSLVVDNAGVVTDASIIYDNGEGFSNGHQERFDGAFKAEVIGKSLENISLSRVGGASLTSGGFNEAVAKIRAERG